MRIAAAVDEENQVRPLPDGPTLVILDTETLQVEQHPNPGHPLTTGRRAATTEFLHAQRVNVVCAVPQTFCPVSHEKARTYGMRFLLLPEGTTWENLVHQRLWEGEFVVEQIQDDLLFLPKK